MSNKYSDGRELYRDPDRAKISGVCAGISDYFGLEVWVVRIIAVSALIFFQFPVLLAYGIAHFVLDPKPGSGQGQRKQSKAQAKTVDDIDEVNSESVFSTSQQRTRTKADKATVQQVWKKGRIPGQMLRKTNRRFKAIEQRLQNLESYVTSNQFQLRKEFQDLS